METKSNEITLIQHQVSVTYKAISINIEGITHEESMIFPNGEGNCMNWVLGHLIDVRNGLLHILGEGSIWNGEPFSAYKRGVIALEKKDEFVDFEELKSYLQKSQEKLEAKLNILDRFNPENINDIATLCFHENYHSGQLGYIRRLLGKSGGIK
ncbi:Uncharacterised protein [Chryseobacterium nakagawai]|uniref:DinB family protein n=1 Tax=Chryseobacterium nakagawai TaxID=1241982 RepID=A0AAD0YRJ8_CHRNA|nr:DinB family protein [Chryseobacterium nakagawai]AZA93794.1 DinB family protein [Chryseobacterium nakagawai]VEH21336.1 Uncharacterised protein [Chryseobacterium nakagawai]